MMTEAYTDLNHTMLYYGDDSQEGAHFTFNFFFVTDLTSSSTADDVTTIVNTWMDNMPKQRVANWVVRTKETPKFRFDLHNSNRFS